MLTDGPQDSTVFLVRPDVFELVYAVEFFP